MFTTTLLFERVEMPVHRLLEVAKDALLRDALG